MVKVVLFDLDGVMIKDPIFSTVYAAEFGLTPEAMLPFLSGVFQKCTTGEADLKKEIVPFLEAWKWTKSVDELIAYWMTHHQNVDTMMVELVKQIRARGITVALSTNQEKYRTDYVWNTLGFKNYFDKKFISYEFGCRKPQTQFYTNILKQLPDIEPDQILFIDDSMNCIKGAESLGFKTYYFTDPLAFEKQIPTLLI